LATPQWDECIIAESENGIQGHSRQGA